jgi:hypothetical protein
MAATYWVTGTEYLNRILTRETVDTSLSSPVRSVQGMLMPLIREWAGNFLLEVQPSGSFMKGTAVLSGTDIDLFISISELCTDSLKDIYETLFRQLSNKGHSPKRQNVSINIRIGGYSVDLVPGKRQNSAAADHSLYRRRADSWTKTNVATHIHFVRGGARQQEIRVIKLWRNQRSLDFPSFYLEMAVMRALVGQSALCTSLESRVQTVFEFLRDKFADARFVDPANTNNIVSDDLSIAAKKAISAAAGKARAEPYWGGIVR